MMSSPGGYSMDNTTSLAIVVFLSGSIVWDNLTRESASCDFDQRPKEHLSEGPS